jgi:hypothetical protein
MICGILSSLFPGEIGRDLRIKAIFYLYKLYIASIAFRLITFGINRIFSIVGNGFPEYPSSHFYIARVEQRGRTRSRSRLCEFNRPRGDEGCEVPDIKGLEESEAEELRPLYCNSPVLFDDLLETSQRAV